MAAFYHDFVVGRDGVYVRFLPHTHTHDHICPANGTAVAHSFCHCHTVVGENGRCQPNAFTRFDLNSCCPSRTRGYRTSRNFAP
ncbi:MAG: hypothetical protein IPM76_13345 [Chloroflexi bacterium]|nr:hypothetical protein [Chloroflexota bacterium]